MKTHTFVAFALTLALVLVSCGTNPKAVLVATHQGFETALAAADDAERLACWGVVDVATFTDAQLQHCTKNTPGLTDAKHQQVSRLLRDAFTAQLRLVPVIKGWTAKSLPPDFTTAESDAQQIFDLVTALDPSLARASWLDKIRTWRTELDKVKAALIGGTHAIA